MPSTRLISAIRVEHVQAGLARGWPFTPLKGKCPIRSRWQEESVSPEETLRWAEEGNIGLRTGAASGVVVIDEDTSKGGSVAKLNLPETVTVKTGGGGRHYYFLAPEGRIGNSAGKIAPHVDVRGDGGQVVFVGSVHPETSVTYEWAPGLSPDDVGLAELPPHVLRVLRDEEPPSAAGEQKLNRACEVVAGAQVGTRNDTLNRQAFIIGGLIQKGEIQEREALTRLGDAARQSALADDEIDRTLARAVQDGKAKFFGRASDAKPCIYVEGGELPAMADSAEEVLLHDGQAPLYERGTLLVRMVRAPAPTVRQGFEKKGSGPLILLPVEPPYLVDRLTRGASWLKWDGRARKDKRVDCPEKVARTVLAREGFRNAPQLVGILSAPSIRPDGSILQAPGYDPQTRLYLDPGSVTFDPVPDNPSHEDAVAAIAILRNVIKDFPWVEPSDEAAALAAMLTALIRKSLRTAPLFAFRAPTMGSGKSLLADVVSMIATGFPAAVMSQGKDEDETRKRVLSLLLEGVQVASIDNVERPLGDPVLCSVLTQELWRDRVLGVSKTATVPTSSTWLATGNNLVFEGDITTRVIPCDLDPKQERPEERQFDVDLYKYVPAHRGQLVAAGLTVLRAYHVADRPDQGLSVFGRFENWSELVRNAVVWCGAADPNAGRARLETYDPVRRQLNTVLLAWRRVFESRPFTVAQVVDRLHAEDIDGAEQALKRELEQVAGDAAGQLDTRRLGAWLVSQEKRIEKGLRVERMDTRQNALRWRVAALGELGELGESLGPGA
ncbi:MAG: bifunctional DNA primase/polymerase [bacterium]|nr:bifunctional DNA primase/polymerase [bacterium]